MRSRGLLLDDAGEPRLFHHGSTSPTIEATDLDPAFKNVRTVSGARGVSFTTDAASAMGYTRPGIAHRVKGDKTRGRVLSAHLAMEHPLDITDAVKKFKKKGMSFGDAKREALKALTPEHDGVIFRGDAYNPDEYQVFSRAQIHARKKP